MCTLLVVWTQRRYQTWYGLQNKKKKEKKNQLYFNTFNGVRLMTTE
jgi:hypothetical protein